MKRSSSTKWRITAILIACIAAYWAQDDDDLAKNNTIPAKCVAAGQTKPQQLAPSASAPDQDYECAMIRNSKRNAQV